MHDPEMSDPEIPGPTPALPEAARTQRLDRPEGLDPASTQKLPLRGSHSDATVQMPRPRMDEPPIRVQRTDDPVGTTGQTRPSAAGTVPSRAGLWKLPLTLGAVVVLGAGAYLIFSRGPVLTPDLPAAGLPVGDRSGAAPQGAQLYFEQAQAGDAHAMRMLGVMYYYGLNVPQDREKGLYWYRKAAEKGSDAARADLNRLEGLAK